MSQPLVLTLYRNSRNAVIGDLYHAGHRIFACSDAATLAAALYSMQAREFTFKSVLGEGVFAFPLAFDELEALAMLMRDQKEADFISLFGSFSQFDFAHPIPGDIRAETHWRASTIALEGTGLITLRPSTPAPAGFAKVLRERNKYIYYPWM